MHFSIIYSNSKNIDPEFESSFASRVWNFQIRLWACNARFFSNETIFSDFFQSLANFPAKGLLARDFNWNLGSTHSASFRRATFLSTFFGFLAREAKALKVLFFSSNLFSNFADFLYFFIFNNFKLLSVIFFQSLANLPAL